MAEKFFIYIETLHADDLGDEENVSQHQHLVTDLDFFSFSTFIHPKKYKILNTIRCYNATATTTLPACKICLNEIHF